MPPRRHRRSAWPQGPARRARGVDALAQSGRRRKRTRAKTGQALILEGNEAAGAHRIESAERPPLGEPRGGRVVVAVLPEVPLRQTHSLAELDDDVESEQSPGGGALVVETTEGE